MGCVATGGGRRGLAPFDKLVADGGLGGLVVAGDALGDDVRRVERDDDDLGLGVLFSSHLVLLPSS